MEFDKSKVYTALNADELEVGSTVIVADSLQVLKDRVRKFPVDKDYVNRIESLLPEIEVHRFKTSRGNIYSLAYLISPPEKPEYKPFSNTKTAYKTITAHGGWIKQGSVYYFVTGLDIGYGGDDEIQFSKNWYSARFICENCTFADDGTPVGEKVEDSDTEEDSAT